MALAVRKVRAYINQEAMRGSCAFLRSDEYSSSLSLRWSAPMARISDVTQMVIGLQSRFPLADMTYDIKDDRARLFIDIMMGRRKTSSVSFGIVRIDMVN